MLVLGVGLDAHEDGEAVERAHDGLGCGRGLLPQRRNKQVHAAFVFAWVRVVQLEEVMESARVLVCAVTRGVDGEPVGERGHGEGRDGEDVDEALVAPRGLLEEQVGGGGGVGLEERVGDEEVELGLGRARGDRGEEGKGHEVPIEVGELLDEGGGEFALEGRRGREGLGRACRLELEELQDACPGLVGEVLERVGEVLEPLEVARKRIWGRGEGLDVCGQGGGFMFCISALVLSGLHARLGDEFAVLFEDLEVFLRQFRWASV